LEPF